jgi:hypothetical protein
MIIAVWLTHWQTAVAELGKESRAGHGKPLSYPALSVMESKVRVTELPSLLNSALSTDGTGGTASAASTVIVARPVYVILNSAAEGPLTFSTSWNTPTLAAASWNWLFWVATLVFRTVQLEGYTTMDLLGASTSVSAAVTIIFVDGSEYSAIRIAFDSDCPTCTFAAVTDAVITLQHTVAAGV